MYLKGSAKKIYMYTPKQVSPYKYVKVTENKPSGIEAFIYGLSICCNLFGKVLVFRRVNACQIKSTEKHYFKPTRYLR